MSEPSSTRLGTATPRAFIISSFALSVVGLIPTGYLTYEHYTGSTTLACSESGTVNCLKVTTSIYSHVMGAPVALLGLLFFMTMTVLCSPKSWALSMKAPGLAVIRLAISAIGVLAVFYLIWVELFRIDAICLWCTAVHATTVLLFGVLIFAAAWGEPIERHPPD